MLKPNGFITAIILIGTLTACRSQPVEPSITPGITHTIQVSQDNTVVPDLQLPTNTPQPPKILNICMGEEPASLFYYGDSTSAARSVLQAIYDGPIDVQIDHFAPVILEQIPSMENGGLSMMPVTVERGIYIADDSGKIAVLDEGIVYRPSGCLDQSCAVEYSGVEPAEMDSMVVEFRIIDGVQWSDGSPLKAIDSVFSFQVARELYKDSSWSAVQMVDTYHAVDELTVQWIGLPGFQTPEYPTYFFSPLPEHILNQMPPEEMLAADITSKYPLGWGSYKIDEWIQGDHITLGRNPNYFRITEGLPEFDFIIFRFMDSTESAFNAFRVGECDVLDTTIRVETDLNSITSLVDSGDAEMLVHPSRSWEQITMGLASLDPSYLPIFEPVEVRQAFAMCVDRELIAAAVNPLKPAVQISYLDSEHPLFNPDVSEYPYDPDKADEQLRLVGWIDHDLDATTPRIASGVPGIPNGTEFVVSYLVPEGVDREMAAGMVRDSLINCGIQIEIEFRPWSELLAPGPEGPVFGRKFDLAQFAWASALEPTCSLFVSEQIPGPYPDYPYSWGGGNAAGFQNASFDASCQQAAGSLRDSEGYTQGHSDAQRIFSEEVPVLPLYTNYRYSAHRSGLCITDSHYDYYGVLTKIEQIFSDSSCQ